MISQLLQSTSSSTPTDHRVSSIFKVRWGTRRQRLRINTNPGLQERVARGGSHLKGNTVQFRVVYGDPHTGITSCDRDKVDLETFLIALAHGYIPCQPPLPISALTTLHLHIRISDKASCNVRLRTPPVFSSLTRFTYLGDPKALEELCAISWDRSFPELKALKICGPTGTRTFRKILGGCPKLRSLFVNSLSREDFEYTRHPLPSITHEALERLDLVSEIDLHFATQNLDLESLDSFNLWMSPKAASLLEACHIGIVHGDWNLQLHFPIDEEFCEEMEEREVRVYVT